MFIPLNVKSDYNLLQSLIKIDDLIKYLVKHNITSCALLDENLNGSMEFYEKCITSNIKPIIGLDVTINEKHIYLYAKNYDGFKRLLKLNTFKQQRDLILDDIKNDNIKIVFPFDSYDLSKYFDEYYLSYKNEEEKKIAKIKTNNIVFINEIRCFEKSDLKYLNYLYLLKEGLTKNDYKDIYLNNYFEISIANDDEETITSFIKDIDLIINNKERYIPKYENKLNDSKKYLEVLTLKGLNKRYKDNPPKEAIDRLNYELSVINKMGFVDYFLIVYDYVLYAKKNNIMVGPGRGSAAGSIVSYSLGITEVNPLDYNLLFERFLNPERVTMPDIDIDFEDTKRDLVVEYVRNKYGNKNVAPIIAYGTLSSKQVIRDVFKLFLVDNDVTDKFAREIDPKLSLIDNLKKESIKKFIVNYPYLKDICKCALKLEGLKKHTTTHAAGVVISSIPLDDIIPVYLNNDELMTGYTMNYLENLGLLKMDFLSLKNLTIIKDILALVKDNKYEDINLNNINLNDERVYKVFSEADTEGIFQFESSGMKNLLQKMKPSNFNDLIAAIALFRPGPMDNIDLYIKRKNGKEKIDYLDDSLEEILKETYGIIIYQEQIMAILVKMANYSYAEADNIRRAMSKKKEEIIIKEKDNFISKSRENGYSEDIAIKVYDKILKFANYGFNKAHSVSYAILGYQMAYLKCFYPKEFILNLLNMSIGSEEKTKEYIVLAKKHDLEFANIDINLSTDKYILNEGKIVYPLGIIKGLGTVVISNILKERENGLFQDYCSFVARTYSLGINKAILEKLILSSALDSFGLSKKSMITNIPIVINYATLIKDLDESLVMKPVLEEEIEYSEEELRNYEKDIYGFYLSNHPSSKYTDVVKINNIIKYFDRTVTMVVLVERVKKIKTKNGDDMAFVLISDDTGEIDMTVFSNSIQYLEKCEKGALIKIVGRVVKRIDKYNINLISIKPL